MCLGIPMRIVDIRGDSARAEVGGLEREISLALLESVEVGQYVIVHAGFAIEKLDEEDAMQTLRLLDQLAEAIEDEESGRGGGAGKGAGNGGPAGLETDRDREAGE